MAVNAMGNGGGQDAVDPVDGVDTLTGLAGPESMLQAVAQAEFDRDPFAVAVIDVHRFGSFNQRHGMVMGDELLCTIGRALLLHAAPGTEACRLGGDRFALITIEPESAIRWVAPIITAIRAAVDRWLEHHHRHQDEDRPEIVAGVAQGLTADVWINAESALQAAKAGIDGPERRDVVEYRPLTTDARRRGALGLVPSSSTMPASDQRVPTIEHRIDPVDRPEPAWLWLRFTPEQGSHGTTTVAGSEPTPGISRSMERWLVEQACRRLTGADRQMRVSVPISAEASQARSLAQHLFPLIERYRVPPSRLVLEITAATIRAAMTGTGDRPGGRTIDPVARFIHELAGVGSTVTVTDFDGSWRLWDHLRRLEIGFLRPSMGLVRAAGTGDTIARRSLTALAANADDCGIELIAPHLDGPAPTGFEPADFNFTYQEQVPVMTGDHDDPGGGQSHRQSAAPPSTVAV